MTSILQTANSALQNEIIFNSYCREMAKDNLSLAGNYITSAFARSVTNPAASLTLKGRCMNLMKASLLLPRAFLLCLPLTNRMTQLGLRFLSPQNPGDFVKSSPIQKAKLKTELMIRYSEDARREFIKGYFQDKIDQKEEFDPSSLNLFDKLNFDSEKCVDIFAKLSSDLNTELVNSSTKEDLLARYSKDTRREFVEDCFKEKIAQEQKITRLHLGLSEDEQTIFLSKLGFTYQECTDIFLKFLAQPSEEAKCSVNLKKEVNQYKKPPHN